MVSNDEGRQTSEVPDKTHMISMQNEQNIEGFGNDRVGPVAFTLVEVVEHVEKGLSVGTPNRRSIERTAHANAVGHSRE